MSKTIAVFFGGKSPEHDVSIISALVNVIPPLKLLGHTVVPIYIAKNGDWFTGVELTNIKTYQTGAIDEIMKKQKPLSAGFNGGLAISTGDKFGRKTFKIEMAFPVMHGSYGEDGSLMGLLRMANVPFVGCDMEASVVAMNKVLAKIVAAQNGIPIVKFFSFRAEELDKNSEKMVKEISGKLKFPLFVKPPHLGSSIGISKVTDQNELKNALEVAAYYDSEILVEEAVSNLIEVTVPIIGSNDNPQPGLVEKPLASAEDFFDFDTKYMNAGGKKGGAKNGKNAKSGTQGYSEIPAKLPDDLYEKSLAVAKDVYQKVGLSGLARIDLLIDSAAKKVYFNEINPMPGGLYAHNFAKAGISNVDLVAKLLDLAEESFAQRNKVKDTFDTNYLKQF